MTAERPNDREGRADGPARGRFVDASPALPRHPRPTVPRQPDAASPRTASPRAAEPRADRPDTPAAPDRDVDRKPDRKPEPQAAGTAGAGLGGWLEAHRVEVLAAEWRALQTGFVDDPAGAVERADELVGRVADLVADAVRERREGLRTHPGTSAGTHPGTEELRLALRDYRSVLDRLLAS